MKRVFSHIKRLLRKFWFILLLTFGASPFLWIIVLAVATAISMLFFDDPIEPKNPDDYFTEDELEKIQSGENLDHEEFLQLLAKYQCFECPVKVDKITTWKSSEVTRDSYICHYEINDKWHRYREVDFSLVKESLLAQLDKKSYKVECVLATNRNVIFRYYNLQTETIEDVVLSKEDLMS
ncbi:MAG: hypothetical protein II949_09330 [Prevotella sp.]|nr:hypothetical protein [Prevotella sp.]